MTRSLHRMRSWSLTCTRRLRNRREASDILPGAWCLRHSLGAQIRAGRSSFS